MKKLYITALAVTILTACSNNVISPQPPVVSSNVQHIAESSDVQVPQSSSSPNSTNSSSDPSSSPVYYSFVVPEVEHIYADEMIQVVKNFGREFVFPEFENIETLDLPSYSVSTNLYRMTVSLNEELLLQGRGVTNAQKEEILKERKDISSIVRCDDMTLIGRRYFGDQFNFPKNLICKEIAPLEHDSIFYTFVNGREMLSTFYLLVDIQEESNFLVATFLPYDLLLDWDWDRDTTVTGIEFFNPNYAEDGVSYFASFEYPDDFDREEADTTTYLKHCYLPVPQDELGTITVTFSREDSGNLIATKCVYNRKR